MSEAAMSAEEGSQPKLPKNNEPEMIEKDNEEGGNIWINLNISGDNKLLEVIKTVKSLRAELQGVKIDNERIMKAQKELNDVILNKLISQEADKDEEKVTDKIEVTSYKRKVVRKAKFCYEQSKNKTDHTSNWKVKRTENFQGRKGDRFINNRNSGSTYKNYRGINSNGSQNLNLPKGKGKESAIFYHKNVNQREPLNCWECGEPHYFKDCPNRKNKVGK